MVSSRSRRSRRSPQTHERTRGLQVRTPLARGLAAAAARARSPRALRVLRVLVIALVGESRGSRPRRSVGSCLAASDVDAAFAAARSFRVQARSSSTSTRTGAAGARCSSGEVFPQPEFALLAAAGLVLLRQRQGRQRGRGWWGATRSRASHGSCSRRRGRSAAARLPPPPRLRAEPRARARLYAALVGAFASGDAATIPTALGRGDADAVRSPTRDEFLDRQDGARAQRSSRADRPPRAAGPRRWWKWSAPIRCGSGDDLDKSHTGRRSPRASAAARLELAELRERVDLLVVLARGANAPRGRRWRGRNASFS